MSIRWRLNLRKLLFEVGCADYSCRAIGRKKRAAVHKAAGVGQPVTQEIAMSVKGDRVECAINGTVVAGYPSAALVAPGKLKSTDGVYGIASLTIPRSPSLV